MLGRWLEQKRGTLKNCWNFKGGFESFFDFSHYLDLFFLHFPMETFINLGGGGGGVIQGQFFRFNICCSISYVGPGTFYRIKKSLSVPTCFRVFSLKCIGNWVPKNGYFQRFFYLLLV